MYYPYDTWPYKSVALDSRVKTVKCDVFNKTFLVVPSINKIQHVFHLQSHSIVLLTYIGSLVKWVFSLNVFVLYLIYKALWSEVFGLNSRCITINSTNLPLNAIGISILLLMIQHITSAKRVMKIFQWPTSSLLVN